MAVLILMFREEVLYRLEIEEGKEYSFGSGKKDDLELKEFAPSQLKCKLKNNNLYFKGKKIADLYTGPIFKGGAGVCISEELELTVCWEETSKISEQSMKLPLKGIVKIGRAEDNAIVIKDVRISRHQLVIRCDEGSVRVEDGYQGVASSNGTYLNGKRIFKGSIKSGDVLDILTIRILVKNSELFFENVNDNLFINSGVMPNVSQQNGEKQRIYRRSPRIREQLPHKDIILAKPPVKGRTFEKRRGGFVSLLSSGAMIGASVATGALSPALMAARAASLVSPVANMAMGHSTNKKEKQKSLEYEKKRQEKYGAYIEAQKALIQQVADKQKEIINYENPSPEDCCIAVRDLKRSLWERRPGDSDFLNIRLGMGYENICVNIKAPMDNNGFQLENDEIIELADSIIEESRIVDNIASRISLRAYSTIGIVGNRKKVIDLVKNMIISITTEHFYEDVKIVGIFEDSERDIWAPLRWLPHVWDENRQSRFLVFENPEELKKKKKFKAEENVKGIEKINDIFLDLVRSRLAIKAEEESVNATHYIVVLGSRELATSMTLLKELVNCNPLHRITTIFAYDLGDQSSDMQISYLPPECRFIINTDDVQECSSAYDVRKADEKFLFNLDEAPKGFDQFCRNMSSITVDVGVSYQEIPTGITFLQGMDVTNVRELDAWRYWSSSRADKSLSTPIAVKGGGKHFYLDVVNHGPHGIVAGMTRSGKSELLASWLLSLAIHYHPCDVSFVVIDYKGGGLANTLEGIPHMVGKITNLGNNIERTMISLNSELKRRQRLFDEVGVKNIGEYINGYRAGKYKEPLPRLLIVTDEFRELRAQEPEFMKSLVSTATIGASLGIHLVLATQNPSGIVDEQIRTNSNFQICLKVQNAAASRDMILRPDAAKITQPGRAYVRVGADEIFELVQSFWSGAPYVGKRTELIDMGNQVRIVEMDGSKLITVEDEKTRFHSEINELEMVSKYLTLLAKEHEIPKMPCPWLPELPRNILFKDIERRKCFDGEQWHGSFPWLKVPVGIYDMPENQSQGTQYIDFEAFGHYGIYGTSGSGKTTLIKSILVGLCSWYTPRDINIYMLDLASGSLNVFEDMPHVGGIAISNEEEKFAKLTNMINKMFENRKKDFLKHGVSSLKSYRENISDNIPAVILVIENIRALFEIYPEYEKLLQQIAADGASYGIYLLYTANTPNDMKYKIAQNIRGAITFELSDKSDYSQLVGKPNDPNAISGIKGRAFFKAGTNPIIFQAVNYIEGNSETEQRTALENLITQMNNCWTGSRPEKIPVMPEKILVSDLKKYYFERNRIPVGYGCTTIEPAYLDLQNFGSTLVVGTVGSGKSEMLKLISSILSTKGSENEIFVIDSARRALESLEIISKAYTIDTNCEKTEQMLTEIIEELLVRQKEDYQKNYTQICILIDDIHEFVSEAGEQAWKRLRGIVCNGTDLGVIVIAAGRVTDISKLADIDSIVGKMVSAQNGFAISGSPSMHSYYVNDCAYDEKNVELKQYMGLLYHNGITEKIKIMEQ